jgi:hypothetical protein
LPDDAFASLLAAPKAKPNAKPAAMKNLPMTTAPLPSRRE